MKSKKFLYKRNGFFLFKLSTRVEQTYICRQHSCRRASKLDFPESEIFHSHPTSQLEKKLLLLIINIQLDIKLCVSRPQWSINSQGILVRFGWKKSKFCEIHNTQKNNTNKFCPCHSPFYQLINRNNAMLSKKKHTHKYTQKNYCRHSIIKSNKFIATKYKTKEIKKKLMELKNNKKKMENFKTKDKFFQSTFNL